MRERIALAVALAVGLAACAAEGESMTPARILALGDSYTIGESVAAEDRWPEQMARLLAEGGFAVEVEIIARTGWTTFDLDAGIDAAGPEGPFDLVTLSIGVNNQYRGLDRGEYREDFSDLLQRAIGFAAGSAERVIVVSIPDWGVTPFAEAREAQGVAGSIDRFNEIARGETQRLGARWVDVTGISRSGEPGLIADDGLHPSGDQYARWVDVILPVAREILSGG